MMSAPPRSTLRLTAFGTALATAGFVLAGALSISSCAIPAPTDEQGELPDSKSFIESGVSTFMERRCGGIDCHGQLGRPLRIYSDWGLRLETNKDGTRDTRATTAAEQLANYRSVVGLEPESLAQCYATKGEVKDFQLLLKPIGPENDGVRHKGGPVLRPSSNDRGWLCLYGWASGTVNANDCAEAAKISN